MWHNKQILFSLWRSRSRERTRQTALSSCVRSTLVFANVKIIQTSKHTHTHDHILCFAIEDEAFYAERRKRDQREMQRQTENNSNSTSSCWSTELSVLITFYGVRDRELRMQPNLITHNDNKHSNKHPEIFWWLLTPCQHWSKQFLEGTYSMPRKCSDNEKTETLIPLGQATELRASLEKSAIIIDSPAFGNMYYLIVGRSYAFLNSGTGLNCGKPFNKMSYLFNDINIPRSLWGCLWSLVYLSIVRTSFNLEFIFIYLIS